MKLKMVEGQGRRPRRSVVCSGFLTLSLLPSDWFLNYVDVIVKRG